MPAFLNSDKFTSTIKKSYKSLKLILKHEPSSSAICSIKDLATQAQANAFAEFLRDASDAYKKEIALEKPMALDEKHEQAVAAVSIKEDKAVPSVAEELKRPTYILEPVNKGTVKRKCLSPSKKEMSLAYERERSNQKSSPC